MRVRLLTPVVGLWVVSVLAAGMAVAAEPDLRLVTAVKEQNTQLVRTLLDEGVDVNTPRPDGATPLLWAVHWDETETATRLLQAGAEPDVGNDQGVTPLALACENASESMVATLLDAGASSTLAQANGVTPLMTAARTGSPTIVERLLAAGAEVNETIPSTGQTALMWATAEGHLDVMGELIAADADVHARSTIGFTPLLFATRNGDLESARLLLDAGARVNDIGSDGTHPLPLAIVSGHDELALALLERGADANGTMHGVGALHAAAGSVDMWMRDWFRARKVDWSQSTLSMEPERRIALIEALLAQGADINQRVTSSMSTGVMGWLTNERGAFEPFSVGTGNLKGATPLWVAAWAANGGRELIGGTGGGSADVVGVLLEGGADQHLTTDDQTTPLMVAAGLGRGTYRPGKPRGDRSPTAEAAVKLLVEAGGDVNAVNEADFTALHGAAFRGLNEVIEYLVDQGADIDAVDFQGRTAFRMAEGSKQTFQFQTWPETAEFLRSLGADTSLGVSGNLQERQQERDARADEDGDLP